jgi:aldehyde dehydrogenase (NAD+)/succinate-semialdehyde dehydrogenase/glutarate-semialdehyde dehydrogenase
MSLPASITPDLLAKLTGMVVSTSGRTVPVVEVYTGEPFVELPQSSPEDVVTAYAAARTAQAQWASWPLKRRIDVMKRFHELLLQKNLVVTDLMQVETGKARRMSFEETCDVLMTTSHYIKAAPRILKERKHGGVVPVVSTSTEVRVPKGVVGLISPWNFPFATSLSDAMPALIAGNGIVLKPDPAPQKLALGEPAASRRGGHDRGHLVVADDPGDLLDQVERVGHVPAPGRGHDHQRLLMRRGVTVDGAADRLETGHHRG